MSIRGGVSVATAPSGVARMRRLLVARGRAGMWCGLDLASTGFGIRGLWRVPRQWGPLDDAAWLGPTRGWAAAAPYAGVGSVARARGAPGARLRGRPAPYDFHFVGSNSK